jgi:signal transduction histidine kinase/ligand-binding sensor domain-containing protein
MNVRTTVVCAVLGLLSSVPSSSAADQELRDGLNGYSVLSWTDGDGRPLGNVYAIAQATDGYLWIGSDSGLFRFDGARFTQWESLSMTALPRTAVTALSASSDGTLWVGFADSVGIRRVRDNKEVPIVDYGRGFGTINAIAQDPDGTLWAAMGRGLYRLDHDRWQQVEVPSSRSFGSLSGVVNVRVGQTGTVWVATTAGVYVREPDKDVFQKVTKPKASLATNADWIWDVAEGADGTLWTTDMATAFSRRSRGGQWSHPRSQVMGYRLARDREGNIWIATVGEGLWRVTRESDQQGSWRIERITLSSGLTSDSVQSVYEDRDGNLWVGTTVGLHRLTRRKLSPVSNVGLATSVDVASDGQLLIGTSNSLIVLEHGALDLNRRRVLAPGVWVTSVAQDRRGTILVAAIDGLYRLIDGRLATVPGAPPDGLTGNRSIVFDGSGDAWIVRADDTFVWRHGELTRFDTQRQWNVPHVSLAYPDHSGRLWVSTSAGQVGVKEPDGQFRLFGPENGLRDQQSVYTFYEDSDHTLWLGTDVGLSALINGRFATLDRDNGLPSSRIGAIVEDSEGYLWLNIDPGLLRVKRSELHKAFADRMYRPNHTIYDSSDGLAGASIVNMRATRDKQGILWFIRGGGLTMVNPKALASVPSVAPRPMRIDAALADMRRIETVAGAALTRNVQTLQINYTALDLGAANKLEFRYRLVGFDADWVSVGNRRQAIYTNLPPGQYRFEVQTHTNGEQWGDPATWRFTLPPMFYQTTWFYAVCVGTLILVVWGAWRVRLQVVQHEFSLVLAERSRMSREIHDTLLQSLVGLTLQISKLVRLTATSPSQAAALANRMLEQVEMYIRDARLSIFDLRSPALRAQGLAVALDEFGHRVTADHGIAFQSHVIGTPRAIASHIENQLLRIGQEAITNAVRHANAQRIDLEVRFQDETIALRVQDDGRGFDLQSSASAAGGHYGLIQMRERAEQIGGQVSISTGHGNGTEVTTTVRVGSSGNTARDLNVA